MFLTFRVLVAIAIVEQLTNEQGFHSSLAIKRNLDFSIFNDTSRERERVNALVPFSEEQEYRASFLQHQLRSFLLSMFSP